jgi:hypothetical protein
LPFKFMVMNTMPFFSAKSFQCLDINYFFMCEFCLYIDKVKMVFMLWKFHVDCMAKNTSSNNEFKNV